MKVAVVGCGHIAGIHIPCILKMHDAQLVALCDQNKLRAQQMAQQYNLPYYIDMGKMLAETSPDVVHILTPPQTHAVLTVQALNSDCHVLVEKPLCLIPEEADTIFNTAKATARLVSVDHSLLWSPLVQKAMQVVNSGELGRIIHIQYVMGDDYLEAVKRGYARWALNLRGGTFCDLIPHPLYLIRAFSSGVRVTSVRACGTGINDLRELWVDFTGDGASASLWMSLNQRPLEHSLRIYCTRETVYIDLRNFCIAVMPERGLPGPIARVVNTVSESWQRGMGMLGNVLGLLWGRFDPKAGTAGAIRAFYKAIAEGKSSPVSLEEARAVVELSTAIWDILEGTSGAIQPAVDEKGRIVVHKTPADFTKSGGDESPKVLVTGGTGFIGSHLIRRLVSGERIVRILCRQSSRLDVLPTKGVELVFGDTADLSSVRQAMKGIKIVYHLAATMGGDWAEHYQGTIVGTKNILQAAVEARVRKIIYVSSLGVLYASRFPNRGTVDEFFPLETQSKIRGNYSRAKLEAEKMVQRFTGTHRLPVCIIRPGLVYGPGRMEFLSDAGFRVSNKLALVVGLGRRRLCLTYVENLVDALLLAEQSEHSTGRVYHIVDTDQPTVRQYIKAYQQVTRKCFFAVYIPTIPWSLGLGFLDLVFGLIRGSSFHLAYRIRSIARGPRFDTSRAQGELGWISQMSFKEGMRKTSE